MSRGDVARCSRVRDTRMYGRANREGWSARGRRVHTAVRRNERSHPSDRVLRSASRRCSEPYDTRREYAGQRDSLYSNAKSA